MPTLLPGDYVLVNKLEYGARLFDPIRSSRGERVEITRLQGFSRIKSGDVIVFHSPKIRSSDQYKMDMYRYLVKRCIGIPGDTVSIEGGEYMINGRPLCENGSSFRENSISSDWSVVSSDVYRTYPYSPFYDWNIEDFGPLYIPKKGDVVILSAKTLPLYQSMIEWETGGASEDWKIDSDTQIAPLAYTFTSDYCFVGGDNVLNSKDSRYWGLVPVDFVVGKAVLIWNSVSTDTHKVRWERVFTPIV